MFISSCKIYCYKGVTFEFHDYLGPIMLRRKSLKERNFCTIGRRQWALFGKWHSLDPFLREQYRIN